jgi:hypothetical protein
MRLDDGATSRPMTKFFFEFTEIGLALTLEADLTVINPTSKRHIYPS